LPPTARKLAAGPCKGAIPGNTPAGAGVGCGMEPTVTDAPDNSRYEIRDGDQLLGQAVYQRRGDQVVFTHTEVDMDKERSGLGSTLVRGALDDVRTKGGTVVPLCSFVRGWIERHPEYQDLVADREG
jgi:predicted GNAT family acetyltransferase